MRIFLSRILFVTILFSPLTASAFTINSTNDTVDKDVGNGICEDADGYCTLRAAIMEANASTTADEINIPVGTYLLTLTGDEDKAKSGDLDILYDTTLIGTGKQDEEVIVDAGAIGERAFDIHYPTETVVMQNFIIQNGSDDFGGAIYNQSAALVLTNMTVQASTASASGGGLYHLGTSLILSQTEIQNNSAYYGGGIFSYGTGDIYVGEVSEISSNQAQANGGGLFVVMPQTESIDVTVKGSKINENTITATDDTVSWPLMTGISDYNLGGTGLYYYGSGDVEISNSQINSNTATTTSSTFNFSGGGIFFQGYDNTGTLNVTHSEVSNNTISSSDGEIKGAGIYSWEADALTFEDATINSNALSGTDTTTQTYGPGIYLFNSLATTITDSNVSENSSSLISDASVSVSSYGNIVAAYAWAEFGSEISNVNISNSYFDNNSTTLDSTGMSGESLAYGVGLTVALMGDADISNSSFSSNTMTALSSDASTRSDAIGVGLALDPITSEDELYYGSFLVSNCEMNFNSLITNSSNVGGSGFTTQSTDYLTITLEDSTVDANSIEVADSSGTGAGIWARNYNIGTFIINNSTISNNTISVDDGVYSHGGGIDSDHNLEINNSTISSNQAENGYGGGLWLYNAAPTKLANVTITKNKAGRYGGLGVQSTDVSLKNTIIAGNISTIYGDDCGLPYGETLVSEGYNFIGDIYGCYFAETTGDQIGDSSGSGVLSAQLGSLKDNGGSTKTHLPKKGSPVIDTGNPDGCSDFEDNVFSVDQRDYTRPFDGDSDGTAICDIGAVERQGTDKDYTLSKPNKKIELPTGIFTH